jgi:hypothetical protein
VDDPDACCGYTYREWVGTTNIAGALLHGAMATSILVLTLLEDEPVEAIFSTYLGTLNTTATNGTEFDMFNFLRPNKRSFSWPLGYPIAAFGYMSMINHVYAVYLQFWNKQLFQVLIEKRRYPVRWIEYAFSASLMTVIIAQECAIQDVHLLFVLFILMAAVMLFGLAAELVYEFSVPIARMLQAFGWVQFIGAWLVIMCAFFQATTQFPDIPQVIYVIAPAMFVIMAWFGAIFFFQMRGANFLLCWVHYNVASLVGKQMLQWLTYGGLQRGE